MGWITCSKHEFPYVFSFLEQEEPLSVSCYARMQREVSNERLLYSILCKALVSDKYKFKQMKKSRRPGKPMSALIYYSGTRTIYPVFHENSTDENTVVTLPLINEILKKDNNPQGVMGKRQDVEKIIAYLPNSRVKIYYDYMVFENNTGALSVLKNQHDQFVVRRATQSDLQELVDIEAEYQKEEVLTPIHEFNLSACRANQYYTLMHQPVYVVQYGGKIIARAQVNGAGKRYEQIGGVFVIPEFRNMHAGCAVMTALMEEIISRGNKPCLYVKKNNDPAQKLYKKLGFSIKDEFTIQYF